MMFDRMLTNVRIERKSSLQDASDEKPKPLAVPVEIQPQQLDWTAPKPRPRVKKMSSVMLTDVKKLVSND